MSDPLRIHTWFWKQPGGAVRYTAEHVNVWAAMMRRNLTIDHELVCVTSDPEGIDPGVRIVEPPRDFEDVRLRSWGPTRPQCLRRLAMFAADAAGRFGRRFVSMDLDCVVLDNIDSLFDRPEPLVLNRGTRSKWPFNGSMLMMTAGVCPEVYRSFTPERADKASRRFIGSDQAWLMEKLGPHMPTWGPEHGVDWWRYKGPEQTDLSKCRLLFTPGPLKPWDLMHVPEIAEAYRL